MSRQAPTGRGAEQTRTAVAVDDPVRAEERRRLARELHDVVAHHLANVALRTMDRLDLADLSRVQAVLADVNSATRSALAELRLLTHVLEDDPGLLARDDAVGELSRRLAPTDAGELWRRRLTEAGRAAHVTVPDAADRLALSVQSTIARTLGTTCDAALAHTAVGARCSAVLRLVPTEVTLRSTVALPTAPSGREPELEQELRGLRERLDLSHGRLIAAVQSPTARRRVWVVVMTLSLD